jgi:hypothetical protein
LIDLVLKSADYPCYGGAHFRYDVRVRRIDRRREGRQMLISAEYVREFPLIPGGGLFFMPVGICIVLGSIIPRARMLLVWAGIALGLATRAFGGKYLRGLSPPTLAQIAFFGVAIVAEGVGFRVFIPRLRPSGERKVLLGTLAIVGAHFILMLPTFGLPILVLAMLCLGNAALAWRLPDYPVGAAWCLDGIFKIGVGATMWVASPAFSG